MRKIILLSLVIAGFILGTDNTWGKRKKMRIAILDLEPIGASEVTARSVSDILRTELHNTGFFRVIERGEMKSILKEQAFQQSGCTETECAVQMGRLLSAQKILIGTLNKLGSKYIINARIVDVERGEMEFAEKARTKTMDDLDIAVEEFAKKITARISRAASEKEDEEPEPEPEAEPEPEPEPEEPETPRAPQKISGVAFRSALLPGWGQFYAGHSTEGYLIGGAMLLSTGGLVLSWLDYSSKLDEYEALPGWSTKDEFNAKYNAANDAYSFRNTMLISTLIVYSLNLLDANFDELLVCAGTEEPKGIKPGNVLGSGLRSALLPGWGQFYSGHSTEGYIFGGAMILSTGGLVLSWLDYSSKLDEYEALPGWSTAAEFNAKYNAANDAYSFRNTMLTITAVIYGINVLDALFDGVFYQGDGSKSGLKGNSALSSGLSSALLPGLGQINSGYTTKGYIYMGLTGLSLGGLVISWLDYSSKLDEYEALPGWSTADEFNAKYNAANDACNFRNIMAITTITIYSLNIIDAIFCGTFSQLDGSASARKSSESNQRISFGFNGEDASINLTQSF